MSDPDILVAADALEAFAVRFLGAMGCGPEIAREVAGHLVEADLAGVTSHGTFRLTQYSEQVGDGWFDPAAEPFLRQADGGAFLVDGGNGFGIPALRLETEEAVRRARHAGTAAIGVVNVAHTGRIGVFAERAADAGCLSVITGGGSRRQWPQVAPHGGTKGQLPTNPYALAMPGGEAGPVVLDFATAAGAGGKIYAARSAGRPLPEGLCIDANGNPTTDPEDYYDGGALLPMAGPKGYGMALIAELVGEAVFGEAKSGMNWICIAIDLRRFRDGDAYRTAAEACLAELRASPPAPGFDRVEVPGERERRIRTERLEAGIPMPPATLAELRVSAGNLGVAADEIDAALG